MEQADHVPEGIHSLQQAIDQFAAERDWQKFHTPKNLSMALAVEAAELMELFQWSDPAVGDFDPKKSHAIEQEVADVFIYLLRFCSVTGIDLLAAAREKLAHNAEKYPAQVVRGKSDKYTEY